MKQQFKLLEHALVFPSTVPTISVEDDEIYGGAHKYQVQKCGGFENGNTVYDEFQLKELQSVQKNDDGSVIFGLQSVQVALVLLDRCQKLNARFPSDHNLKQMKGLEMFLEGCEDRVKERINRGVMGELKK